MSLTIDSWVSDSQCQNLFKHRDPGSFYNLHWSQKNIALRLWKNRNRKTVVLKRIYNLPASYTFNGIYALLPELEERIVQLTGDSVKWPYLVSTSKGLSLWHVWANGTFSQQVRAPEAREGVRCSCRLVWRTSGTPLDTTARAATAGLIWRHLRRGVFSARSLDTMSGFYYKWTLKKIEPLINIIHMLRHKFDRTNVFYDSCFDKRAQKSSWGVR